MHDALERWRNIACQCIQNPSDTYLYHEEVYSSKIILWLVVDVVFGEALGSLVTNASWDHVPEMDNVKRRDWVWSAFECNTASIVCRFLMSRSTDARLQSKLANLMHAVTNSPENASIRQWWDRESCWIKSKDSQSHHSVDRIRGVVTLTNWTSPVFSATILHSYITSSSWGGHLQQTSSTYFHSNLSDLPSYHLPQCLR